MARRRKRWPAKEKLKIIKECQESGAPISEVCRRHGINTGQYYQWLRLADQGAVEALDGKLRDKPGKREQRLQQELSSDTNFYDLRGRLVLRPFPGWQYLAPSRTLGGPTGA